VPQKAIPAVAEVLFQYPCVGKLAEYNTVGCDTAVSVKLPFRASLDA